MQMSCKVCEKRRVPKCGLSFHKFPKTPQRRRTIGQRSHPSLSPKEKKSTLWLASDSEKYQALQKIVLGKKILNDMGKLTSSVHTGSLEVFHSVLLKYCPKRVQFSYKGMLARLKLTVLDHNYNLQREVSTTADGTERFKQEWSKRRKEWSIKPTYTRKT
jgi:hypothetical protein